MAYTTDDLVTAVRRLAYLPDAGDITDAEILSRADEEMDTLVADAVKAGREGFWLTSEDTALSPSVLAYQIPRRALGRGVVGVMMVNSTGTTFTIPQIDPVIGWNGRTTSISSYCYSFQADKIVFPTPPPSGYSLRVLYLRRPSRMVSVASGAAVVTAPTTTTITIGGAVPAWLSGITVDTPYTYVDVVRGSAPFDPLYVDRIGTLFSAPTLTLDATTPVDISDFVDTSLYTNARIDYVCRQDETVYPMLPIELHRVLEAATAVRLLESVKDAEGAQMAMATLRERKRAAVDILEPRNQEGSRPIVRARSPLRQTFGIGRRWR